MEMPSLVIIGRRCRYYAISKHTFETLHAGINLLSFVKYFKAPKLGALSQFDKVVGKYKRSKAGKLFLRNFGANFFQQDLNLHLKRGGLFGIMKTWVRTREFSNTNQKAMDKTLRWLAPRCTDEDLDSLKILLKNRNYNRLKSVVNRKYVQLAHPLIEGITEVKVERCQKFGFIISLNKFEDPYDFEMRVRVFYTVKEYSRSSMDSVLIRKNKILK